ncbi:MAG: hypothetical protein EOP12_03395 [Pseudomonas sp.]|nr:MAG: hypothetical protein EOP12_03395 [Pseudomonas sp.]
MNVRGFRTLLTRRGACAGLAISSLIVATVTVIVHVVDKTEPMLKRTQEISVVEADCSARPFSLFATKDRSFFSRGLYVFYEGAQDFTRADVLRMAERSNVNLGWLENGDPLVAVGYFGQGRSVDCVDQRMKALGYLPQQGLRGDPDYWWISLSKASYLARPQRR